MDQEELRLNCLRMAYELGGKTEAIISAANDLMSFVTRGPTSNARAFAPEPAITEGTPCDVSAPEVEPAVAVRIAACGTALELPDGGDLAQAERAVEVKTASEAEPAAAAEATEAVPSESTYKEAATIAAPPAELEAAEPAAAPSPETVEPPAVFTNGGSAAPAAAAEVEATTVTGEPVASASEQVAASPEEHAPAPPAPVTTNFGQEHTGV